DLLSNKGKWKWGTKEEAAFEGLKSALAKPRFLYRPNPNLPFTLQTDASGIGMAAVLYQKDGTNRRVIAYASVKFSPTEQRYHVNEQECLALIWATRKFRPYLEDRKFKIRTDSRVLTWVQTTQNKRAKLARWALELQHYNFELEHCPGRDNELPDFLSRNPSGPTISIDEDVERAFWHPSARDSNVSKRLSFQTKPRKPARHQPFTKARSVSDQIRIQPATVADFRSFTRFMEAERIPFHTFTLPEVKTTRVVLRGIPVQVSTDEVFADLKRQGFNPISTHRMHTGKRQLPLVLLEAPLDQAKEVWKMKTVCSLMVKVEKPKKSGKAAQCHRCQRFFHAQRNCTAEHRCVKCGKAHDTKVCAKERKEPPKCANCNGPHTANYRDCPQFQLPAAAEDRRPQDNRPRKGGRPQGSSPSEGRRPQNSSPQKGRRSQANSRPKVVAPKANPTVTKDKGGTKKTAHQGQTVIFGLQRNQIATAAAMAKSPEELAEKLSAFVAFWNANGLRAARDELEEFVDRLQLDIVRRNGNFVSNRVKHSVLAAPDLRNREAVSINVATANGPLRLFACYNRPQIPILEEDLQTLFDGNTLTIAAGDFNAKHINWESRRSNRNGNILNGFTDQHLDISVLAPVEPTFYRNSDGAADILDVAIVKNVVHQVRLSAINDLSSDHNPVLMQIGNEANDPIVCRYTSTSEQSHRSDPQKKSTRRSKPSRRRSGTPSPPPLGNGELRPQDWRFHGKSGTSSEQKGEPGGLHNVPVIRDERWEVKLQSLTTEDNSVWRMSRVLRSDRKPLPPIHSENGIVFTDEEKAEAFALSMSRQCSLNLTNADLEHVEEIEDHVESIATEDPDEPLTLTPKVIVELTERLIRSRLLQLTQERHIVPDEQFGFRSNHSTTDQLLRVGEHASISIERKQVTGAVFLDVAKAFDAVWHDGLIYKLHQTGIPLAMVQMIRSFLDGRRFQVSNRFELLNSTAENNMNHMSNEETSDNTHNEDESGKPPTSNKNNVNIFAKSKHAQFTEGSDNKTAPIVLREVNKWHKIADEMTNKNINYLKAKNTPEGIKITPQTVTDYSLVIKYFDNANIQYHSYQLKQDKTLKVVLKGIPTSIKTDDIEAELNDLGYEIMKISRMTNRHNEEIAMVLTELERKFTSIYSLEVCCHLTIKVEVLRKKSYNGQCHRCQMYGHSQPGCKADFKCLKCAEDHSTHACTKTKATPATCANCGGPHPANFSGCPAHPKQIKTQKQTSQIQNSNKVQPNLSYADASNNIKFTIQPSHTKKPPQQKSKESISTLLGDMLIQFSATNPTAQQKINFLNTTTELINQIFPNGQ
ncbi:hypothetical protein TcasGA2_TC034922, partial [Tribolium castaneum]